MNQSILYAFLLVMTFNSNALAGSLADYAYDLAREIDREELSLTRRQVSQIERALSSIERALDDRRRPPRPPRRSLYTGHCEVDDDRDFDAGQDVYGEVRGASVMDIYTECVTYARRKYANYSFKVTKIQLQIDPVREGLHHGHCEVDDDRDFDAGQFVMGTLVGRSMLSVVKECRDLANLVREDSNSFKLTRTKSPSRRGDYSATCHVDDDHDFDTNQFVFELSGRRKLDLDVECEEIANTMFPDNNTYKTFYH